MKLAVNGVDLHVELAGEGSPLLLLHGFTGSGAGWARQMAAWAPFFTTIAVDLLGHGQSDAPLDPARYTMAQTVADLVAVLDRLEIGRAHVLGYSLGGRVALALAAWHPARVGALVLESASPGLADPEERAARVAADVELAAFVEREGVPAFVARWERLPLWASQERLPAAERAQLHAQRLANRAVGLANSLRGLGTGSQPSFWHRLASLPGPTLLIAGREDTKFADLARQMGERIPRNEVMLVHLAGHAVHLEQPAVFSRLVRDFLLQHDTIMHNDDIEGVQHGNHMGTRA